MSKHSLAGLFVKVPLSMFRAGLFGAFERDIISIYLTLKSFVHRGNDHSQGSVTARRLNRDGFVISEISQSKLASLLGMRRQTINIYLKRLNELGWIRYDVLGYNKICTYVLGNWKTIDGNRVEEYLADIWCDTLHDSLQELEFQHEIQMSVPTVADRVGGFKKSEEFAQQLIRKNEYIKQYSDGLGQQIISAKLKEKPLTFLRSEAVSPTTQLYNTQVTHPVIQEDHIPVIYEAQDVSSSGDTIIDLSEYKSSDNYLERKESDRVDTTLGLVASILEEVNVKREDKNKMDFNFDLDWGSGVNEVKHNDDPKNSTQINDQTKPTQNPPSEHKQPTEQQELFRGSASSKEKSVKKPTSYLSELYALWSDELTKAYPDHMFPAWTKKEFAQVARLVKSYGDPSKSTKVIAAYIKYFCGHWGNIKKRYNISASYPTIGLLCSNYNKSICPEAQQIEHLMAVVTEYTAFKSQQQTPSMLSFGSAPPRELYDSYKAAVLELNKLGIKV